ncbi:MAG: hypothetical protein RL701_4666 [Pseudomonadota bacterium]
MSKDKNSADDALLPPLDDEPGPMPQLSAAEADAMAWGVVSRWSPTVPGMEPADAEVGPARPLSAAQAERMAAAVTRRYNARRWAVWGVRAAVALLAFSVAGVSFAAVRMWQASRASAGATLTSAQLGERKHLILGPRVSPPPTAAAAPAPALQPTAAKASARRDVGDANVDAASLLARANAMRAERRWAAAERLYTRALGAGATEQQRYVALVAAASLALQHTGKPSRALSLYRRALNLFPNGDLSEEARYGVAESQRARGDTEAEIVALRTFVSAYPQSLQTPTARKRLTSLEMQGL